MELQWPLILFTFFVCFASGTLLMQGVLTFLGKGKATQLPALIASLVLLAIGGVSVFLHLEHWERIFNGFGHITSGITIEFIGCVVFFVVLVLFFLMMRRAEDGMAPKWCGVLAVIVGIAMPVVTGDSYLMGAIPAWDTPLLPVYYAVNAVFMGSLAMLVISGVLAGRAAKAAEAEDAAPAATVEANGESELAATVGATVGANGENELCVRVGLVAGVVQAVVVIAYAVYISTQGSTYTDIVYYFDPTLPDVSMVDIESVVSAVLAGSLAPLFYVGVLAVGSLGALAALFLAQRKQAAGSTLALYGGVGLVCAILGGICWRCALYVVAVSVFALY